MLINTDNTIYFNRSINKESSLPKFSIYFALSLSLPPLPLFSLSVSLSFFSQLSPSRRSFSFSICPFIRLSSDDSLRRDASFSLGVPLSPRAETAARTKETERALLWTLGAGELRKYTRVRFRPLLFADYPQSAPSSKSARVIVRTNFPLRVSAFVGDVALFRNSRVPVAQSRADKRDRPPVECRDTFPSWCTDKVT